YHEGNFAFIDNIIHKLGNKDIYIVHMSSLMIFMDDKNMTDSHRAFVTSKLNAEKRIQQCPKYLIIRPCNLFGIMCAPYYNNIIVSLVDQCLNDSAESQIKNINVNSFRYHMSIYAFVEKVVELILGHYTGIYNIIHDKLISMSYIHDIIFKNVHKSPTLTCGPLDQFSPNKNDLNNVIIHEDIESAIGQFIIEYRDMLQLTRLNPITKRDTHVDTRGDMIEISSLHSKRLYLITIHPGEMRGNHYHFTQHEEFFVTRGVVTVLLRHITSDSIYISYMHRGDHLKVNPDYIHTFINTSFYECELIVVSTQEYVKGKTPDTSYVSIFALV
ncbi:MAG: cupin domain-containing protein, partial [Flavobacteriia bacterium]|nr:cupin domain-containing protein [Flavobacteriia bacterium]